ncbi:4-hydroxybenzoate octaprenyltransferase [Brachymonas chironomi]|uniref:4-hydroxybenzoate octaprenyltransferase n=1 Tax=Brachymonas chironomi TaxID=491919 RepID=UPI00035F37E4|nr:4-hydroxybenzoate octaprenyltransferase [Brachymonas chironomi]
MQEKIRLYLDLIRWNRPAGWLLLLWPTLAALWLAARGFPGWHLLLVFTAGTILMRSAGCCINDVADRDFDRHVKRTVNRPITSGRISVKEALLVGLVLTLIAFLLVLTTNTLTILWSIPAVIVTIIYPFTKRFFSMPQAVLGVAYSMGLPMAFAAVLNSTPPVVWWLLVANLCWVLAYDTEYAMVDRDDDLKIGMKTSAITLGRWDVPVIMLWYAAHTAIWWTVLWQHAGLGSADAPGWKLAVWGITLLVAVAQVLWHYALIRTRERERCFRAFTQNHWIGFVVFVAAAALIH